MSTTIERTENRGYRFRIEAADAEAVEALTSYLDGLSPYYPYTVDGLIITGRVNGSGYNDLVYKIETLNRQAEKRAGEAETAKANEAAAQANAEAGLPELTGSKKQIAWAESIRREAYHGRGPADYGFWAEKIEQARDELAACDRQDPEDEIYIRTAEATIAAVEELMSNPSAAWWIDNRGNLNRLYQKTMGRILAEKTAD